MKYMLLVRTPLDAELPDADLAPWIADAIRHGRWLEGHRLEGPSDATTVRVRDGKALIADGPFAEFKEHIAGFEILEATSLDDAATFVAGHPVARIGAIEVRQVWEEFDALVNAGRGEPMDASTFGALEGTRYLLLMAETPDVLPSRADGEDDVPPLEWIDEMERRGVPRSAHRLRPAEEPDAAATVRVRRGKPLITHGPYAEVWEQIAGYELVVASDLDDAIDIAAMHPCASLGGVEIRPLRSQES